MKNRIIGLEYIPANQLLANPDNARRHPAQQREALRGSLETLGWYDVVIQNRSTGYLIDGHARVEEILSQNETQEIPVLVVEMEHHEEAQALANHDWITNMAEYDRDTLDRLLQRVESDDPRVQQSLATLAQVEGLLPADAPEMYSREVKSPVYEPSKLKPSVDQLYNADKAERLIERIEDTDLPLELRDFLIAAAYRHTVFDFTKIADYYAHAPGDVQRLMEDSALIIIDFNRAIELGFVNLTERLSELQAQEFDDDDT
jgi:hypothetical protein